MGYIVDYYEEINQAKFLLLDYLIQEEVYKELGEPILHKSENKYLFLQPNTGQNLSTSSLGFICFNIKNKVATLKYAYVFKQYRGKGLFSSLYNIFEKKCKEMQVIKIKIVSSHMALPIYLHYGYEVAKKYKICTHLYKNL